jgi:hypothetical protein
MKGTEEPAKGFLGFLQQLGGVILGVVEIFNTWNGRTFTISKELRDSLEKVGILDFFLKLSTWVVRIIEFSKNFGKGFISVFKDIGKPLEAFGSAISKLWDSIIKLVEAFGFAKSETISFGLVGGLLGEAIGYIIIAPLYALLWVLEKVTGAIAWLVDGITATVKYFGGIDFSGMLDTFVGFGATMVHNIMTGLSNSWDSLKQLLYKLVSTTFGDTLGGEIMDFFGLDIASSKLEATGGNMPIVQTAGMVNKQISEINAMQTASPPTVFDKTVTKTESINLNVSLDSERIHNKMVELDREDFVRQSSGN